MSIACHSFLVTSTHASIKPMQRVGVDMLDFGPETPAEQAARIVAAGDSSPYLYVSHPLGEDGAHSVFDQNTDDVAASGFDLAYFTPKYETLFDTLNDAGIVPAKIIFDLEGGPDYFGIMAGSNADRVAKMQSYYDDATTYAGMTAAMKALAPADFAGSQQNYATWINWFNENQCEALREIRDIARSSFGLPNLVATNWGDLNGHHYVSTDNDGNPHAETSVTSGYSAPIMYFDLGKVTNAPLTKHRFWNLLINVLNITRAGTITHMTPWVPNAIYRSDNEEFGTVISNSFCAWLWEQMIRLMIEAGCTDFIFWNPNAVPHENDLMAAILADYSGQTFTPISGQSAIALDANSITMGTRTLTYATFLGVLANGLSRKKKQNKH
jgi:hypothetical protein